MCVCVSARKDNELALIECILVCSLVLGEDANVGPSVASFMHKIVGLITSYIELADQKRASTCTVSTT